MIFFWPAKFYWYNYVEFIIIFGLCWFFYPFFKTWVIYLIKRRKELKEILIKKMKDKS